MQRSFHEELKGLKREILSMGLLAESALAKAVAALLERDRGLAADVIQEEHWINRAEIEIDDAAHGLLALEQPMAADLRLITAILRINTDLERIGDHAVNVAEQTLKMIAQPRVEVYVGIPQMAQVVQRTLREALQSFENEDVGLARKVLNRDDEIDSYNDSLTVELEKLLQRDPALARAAMSLLLVSHNLERVGDLANNMAEDVIYLKQGKEVRHHIEG